MVPKRSHFWQSIERGPALIDGNLIVSKLGNDALRLGEGTNLVNLGDLYQSIQPGLKSLQTLIELLYQKLNDEPPSVTREQAERWLSNVECNVGFLLETIRLSDERQKRYVLGVLIKELGPIVFDVEAVLRMLYAAEQLEREEGKPGHLLAKLRQVSGIGDPFSRLSHVRRALGTREPNGLQASDD